MRGAEDRGQSSNRWRRRTIRALIVSQVSTVSAIGLYVAGVAIYFTNFNFGSGGDSRGALVLVAALCLGVVAVIGDLFAILAAWLTWRHAGSARWLAAAISLPLFETAVMAWLWRRL